MTKSNREIAEEIVESSLRVKQNIHNPVVTVSGILIHRITAALDEVGAKAQRYREALEFYADKDNWKSDGEDSLFKTSMFDDLNEVNAPSPYCKNGINWIAGKRAREALEEGKGE